MTTIQNGGAAIFRVSGKDDTETTRDITGTISTSDTVRSYIAKDPTTSNKYVLKAIAGQTAAGALAPVDVTVNALNDRGDALPPQTFNFQIQGPALPPPATHVVISEGPFAVDGSYSAPADPGTGTISL